MEEFFNIPDIGGLYLHSLWLENPPIIVCVDARERAYLCVHTSEWCIIPCVEDWQEWDLSTLFKQSKEKYLITGKVNEFKDLPRGAYYEL